MEKKKRSLYISMLMISVVPLLFLGIATVIFSSVRSAAALYDEVENGLRSVGTAMITMYDRLYPGII